MPNSMEERLTESPSRHLLGTWRKESLARHKKDLKHRALRLRNAVLGSHFDDIDADTIYHLINFEGASDETKIQSLREMPLPLNIKRQVLEKLDTNRRIRMESRTAGLLLRWHLTIRSLSYDYQNFLYMIELWRAPIKTVQGKLGSSVASYFYFLRWLLFLNVMNFFVTLCFILFPQSLDYQKLKYNPDNTTYQHSVFFDFVTGGGRFMMSLLYFGAYSSETIYPVLPYNLPLAYLICIVVNWLVNLIAISITLTAAFPRRFVETGVEAKNVFFNKVISGWDYSIESEETAVLQRRAICKEFRDLMERKKITSTVLTRVQRWWKKISFVLVNLFSLALIGAFGYVTYLELKGKSHLNTVPFFQEMVFALMVSFGSVLFLYLLKFLEMFETYLTAKVRLYFTMVKVLLLRLLNLGIVTYFWMEVYKPARGEHICYENELGSEFYRLIMVHFWLVVIFFTFIGEFLRKLIHKYVTPRLSLKEFDVPYNILDLIYFQALTWLALFCIPQASLIMIVVLLLLFYIKKHSALHNCSAPRSYMSATEAHSFYVTLVFILFFFSAITVAYTIFGLETSDCGPFEKYDHAGDVIRELLSRKKQESVFWRILTAPPILFTVFCALCLFAHFVKSKADAYISAIRTIQETIILASKDRVFLLKMFDDSFYAAEKHDRAAAQNIRKQLSTIMTKKSK